jgi:hypothetical protein
MNDAGMRRESIWRTRRSRRTRRTATDIPRVTTSALASALASATATATAPASRPSAHLYYRSLFLLDSNQRLNHCQCLR